MPPKATKKPSPTPLVSNDWTDPINDRGDYFKPEVGKKYRVHLLRVPYGKRLHFISGVGFVHSDSEWSPDNKKCVERGEIDNYMSKDPDMRYLAPIVVYDTDKQGQISGPASKVDFSIQNYSMPKSAYQQLFDLSIEWGADLFKQDLILTVAQSGTMVYVDTITVASKGALSSDPTLRKRIMDEYDEDKYQQVDSITKLLGQTLTLEELQAKQSGEKKPAAGGKRSTRNPND